MSKKSDINHVKALILNMVEEVAQEMTMSMDYVVLSHQYVGPLLTIAILMCQVIFLFQNCSLRKRKAFESWYS